MKCEEYRQTIGADPAYDGGAEHLRGCEACREYRSVMLALDASITQALAIDVPELEMPELPGVSEETVVPLPRRRPAAPVWLAMAATIAIAAILGVRMLGIGVQYESLADEVLAHLDHEPAALRVTDAVVSDARLHAVVPASVADLGRDAGLITYAQSCIINGKTIPHLVIQGAKGPVTVLLMPEEEIGAAIELSGENVKGIILPVGRGSVAFIGAAGEQLDTIRDGVLKSVTWTT